MRCGEKCDPLKYINNLKKCTNCHGQHASTFKNCTVLKTHIQKRFHHNMTTTYAQSLNHQQHRLNLTQLRQQNEITELNELHKTLLTLQNTLTELKTTQQQQQQQLTLLNETITKQQQTQQQQTELINKLTETSHKHTNDILENKKQAASTMEYINTHIIFSAKLADATTYKINSKINNITEHLNKHIELLAKQNINTKIITSELNEIITYNKTLTTEITPKLIYDAKVTNYKYTLNTITNNSIELYNEHQVTLLEPTEILTDYSSPETSDEDEDDNNKTTDYEDEQNETT